MKIQFAALCICLSASLSAQIPSYDNYVEEPDVTILSTMLSNFAGTGEWGFSALIQTNAGNVLFDTGFKQTTAWDNARTLGIDLSTVNHVVLSHFHTDHTGGLLHIRKRLMANHPNALSRVYVGRGFFQQRYQRDGTPVYSLSETLNPDFFVKPKEFRQAAEALGIKFIELDKPTEILPGIYLTGPIKRKHDERNVSPGRFLDAEGKHIDNIPESQVAGLLTRKGWLLISGCGHAGIVNATLALQSIRDVPVTMGIGGFHLFRASNNVLDWTADHLRTAGITSFVGAHCTGTAATYHIKERLNLAASKVSIGAVGTRIDKDLNIIRASVE